jgi:protocatechuate 3,4-dioxygenase beta subunit
MAEGAGPRIDADPRACPPPQPELQIMTSSRSFIPVIALALALTAAACGASTSTAAPLAAPATAAGSAAPGEPAASGGATSAASAEPSAVLQGAGAANPACTAPATPTLAQTDGPYYTAGAPQDADLATDGMAGTRMTFTGFVVDASCIPIAGAKVETWQADANGVYDNAGYTLRGWVLTDADGRFTIHTVVPGEYPGRTEHIHVKVTPPGGATLTSQMYFPGTQANDGDGIYDPSLLLTITQDGDALVGEYTFVIGG